jgi:5-formyltetrahydrofolate cyclo-ligase
MKNKGLKMTYALNFQTKKEYRDYAKKFRATLDISKISFLICENIKNQEFYKNAVNILGFYPFNSEISLIELYKDNSKNWFLPSIKESTKEIYIHSYKYGDELIENRLKVPEPITQKKNNIKTIDIVFVPALMADKSGFRLGYGAGYYDRFLPLLSKSCIKIVPVPEKLFTEKLPLDEFDVPANYIVTENICYSVFLK